MGLRADVETAGPLIIGGAAAHVRRSVGPAAWCTLEVLAASPRDRDEGAWIVDSSVRALAAQMGVAKNTAHRALVVLRRAHLVDFVQRRDGTGRFGSCSYRLTVASDVLSQPTAHTSHRVKSARVAEHIQQLALLPSD